MLNSKQKKMEKRSIGLITEAFGHGFMALNMAKTCSMTPVAYSEKETKEEFEAHVNQIFNNLVFFCPDLQKATWEQRESLQAEGWNIRKDLLEGNIPQEFWDVFALTQLIPSVYESLPTFCELKNFTSKVMFVPQKLISDNMCGVNAAEQSVSLDVFNFLKGDPDKLLVLGQHFHKVNDLDKVKAIVNDFDAYVAGLTENPEVLGVRGIPHKMYWDLYRQLDCCIGIAGTHTWFLLTCFPNVPQIILYNKKTVENWKGIEAAYRQVGNKITCLGYDDTTDMQDFAKEVEEAYRQLWD